MEDMMKKNCFVLVAVVAVVVTAVPFTLSARTFSDASQRHAKSKMSNLPFEVRNFCETKHSFVDRKAKYVDYNAALSCAYELQSQRLAKRPDSNSATVINF